MLSRLFKRRPDDAAARSLYAAIVAAARQPAFYTDFGISDTLEGRFELLVLHGVLATRRLAAGGEACRALSQPVFDIMLTDLDRSLRELGVGDLSVPKRMRRMAEAYYGRAKAYGLALEEDAPDGTLGHVLARNVYGGESGPARPEAVAALSAYAAAAAAALTSAGEADLCGGKLPFPDAAGFIGGAARGTE